MLKLIAIITMFIDHIGAVVLEVGILQNVDVINKSVLMMVFQIDAVLRTIGRISFPIFCFLLVEGFCHTKNFKKYALRLFLFALLSEIPFDLAVFHTIWNPAYQNVFFTLLISLLMLKGVEQSNEKPWIQIFVLAGTCFIALLVRSDYTYMGVLLTFILYLFRKDSKKRDLFGALMAASISIGNFGAAALAFIPIHFYNGERGKISFKYVLYAFYPVHLLVLWIVRIILLPS